MLVLTRQSGKSIRINNDITISILSIQGSQVRVGIEAPREVPVHREEMFQRLLAEEAKNESKEG